MTASGVPAPLALSTGGSRTETRTTAAPSERYIER